MSRIRSEERDLGNADSGGEACRARRKRVDHGGEPSVHTERRQEVMIETQIVARGVRDEDVLQAMRQVPREQFVPAGLQDQAYEDRALPIGPGQTISQPYIVAYMTKHLGLTRECKVLEVGTGTGYQAAVLARLARVVHTVERDASLSAAARCRLESLGILNVRFHVGDGSLGYAPGAPFNRIMATAGCPEVPQVLVDQLVIDGVLLVPVGDTETQTLVRIRKRRGGTVESPLIACRFVKMVGRGGWPA